MRFLKWINSTVELIGSLFHNQKSDKKSVSFSVSIPLVAQSPMPKVFDLPSATKEWKGVVIHHSATPTKPSGHQWEAIRRYHTSFRVDGNIVTEEQYNKAVALGSRSCEKPWSDIGYHLGIERNPEDGIQVRIGRSWLKSGAHAGFPGNSTFNDNYLGLCMVGNYDAVAPDKETWELCLTVVRQLMERFKFHKRNVLGHRETYGIVGVSQKKTCPGLKFDLNRFREEL